MTTAEETHALDQISERLHGRFPEASVDTIRTAVDQVHHQYDGSPIRDFIPVLVEREVVDQLEASGAARHRARV